MRRVSSQPETPANIPPDSALSTGSNNADVPPDALESLTSAVTPVAAKDENLAQASIGGQTLNEAAQTTNEPAQITAPSGSGQTASPATTSLTASSTSTNSSSPTTSPALVTAPTSTAAPTLAASATLNNSQTQSVAMTTENQAGFIKSLLAKAQAKIQMNKQKKLSIIMQFVAIKGKITNNEAEKMLRISDKTAERYLNKLVTQGKLMRAGEGRDVFYVLPR